MNVAKIRLSAQEMDLVKNAEWILTKNAVMQKARHLLELLQNNLRSYTLETPANLFDNILVPHPKISRGENYHGLPYLILDYPRYFTRENVCAIRCMFWWGHFFSITLHLSGKYKQLAGETIARQLKHLGEKQYSLSAKEEWEHHFSGNHYQPAGKISDRQLEEMLQGSAFIKIAKHYPLQIWEDVIKHLEEDYRYLLGFCTL